MPMSTGCDIDLSMILRGHENDDLAVVYLFARNKEILRVKDQELTQAFPVLLKDRRFKVTDQYSLNGWFFGKKNANGEPEQAPDEAHRYMSRYAYFQKKNAASQGDVSKLAAYLKAQGCTEDPGYTDVVLRYPFGGYSYYGGYKPRWAFVLG